MIACYLSNHKGFDVSSLIFFNFHLTDVCIYFLLVFSLDVFGACDTSRNLHWLSVYLFACFPIIRDEFLEQHMKMKSKWMNVSAGNNVVWREVLGM